MVPEGQMQLSRSDYVLLALSEGWFISEFADYIKTTTMAFMGVVSIIFEDLFVTEDQKLFIEGRIELFTWSQLGQSFLFLMQTFHQKQCVLYFEWSAVREFLYPLLVHVLRMLQQQLMLVQILRFLNVFFEWVLPLPHWLNALFVNF